MTVDNKLKAYCSFNRETLRKTILCQHPVSGEFMILTKILNPDTLAVTCQRCYFLAASMKRVVGLYLAHFCPDGKIEI